MKKTNLIILLLLSSYLLKAQCGNFVWENIPVIKGKAPSTGGLVDSKDKRLVVGNSMYLLKIVYSQIMMGVQATNELFLNKYNSETFENESSVSFIKKDLIAFKEATGIDKEKEYYEDYFLLEDKIVLITTVKVKKQSENVCVARIINLDLTVDKYVIFDTIGPYDNMKVLNWGSGFLVNTNIPEIAMKKIPASFSFKSYDNLFNRTDINADFNPDPELRMTWIYELLPLPQDQKVIANVHIKGGGEALVLFDLKNIKIEFFDINIKDNISNLNYKLNRNGDLVVSAFFLVENAIKNAPDVKGMYLATFKKGTIENINSCNILFKQDCFGKYCESSLNMTKTYLRYIKLIDICFDNEDNIYIAGESMAPKFNSDEFAKGEIIVFKINEFKIIDEYHIPKMIVNDYGTRTKCDMFSYNGGIYLTFPDNPINLDNYSKEQVEKLNISKIGMRILVKLDKGGKYNKKCLISQEENIKKLVSYYSNTQNFESSLMFQRFDGSVGKYLINKE